MVTLHDAFASKLRAQRKRLQAMCPKTPMYYIQLQRSLQKKKNLFLLIRDSFKPNIQRMSFIQKMY